MWKKIIRFIKLRIRGYKEINGTIEVIRGNKVTIRRLKKRLELTLSEDRVIYSDYEDWMYLQTKKGHPGTFKTLWEATKGKQQRAWDFVGIKSDDKVLEVGFRDGYNLKELEKYCLNVIGIEINKDAINNAKELGCQVFLGDIQQRTPFEDNYFDLIIMLDVLEHCYLPEKALRECNRLLRPEGRIIIEVPFESKFNKNILHGHASLFRNKRVFEKLLQDNDFSVVRKDLSDMTRNLFVVVLHQD